MAQSLSSIYVHIIFSTKNRELWLDAEWLPDLWAYMASACDGQNCHAVKVGGVEDHIHALIDLHRTVAVSNLVGEIKSESSKWIKREKKIQPFGWQAGYGAFSVSRSNRDGVVGYIVGQAKHHAKQDFKEEFRAFLGKHDVEYDERYVWD